MDKSRKAEIESTGANHDGYLNSRLTHPGSYREKIFHDEWRDENRKRLYGGHGILQGLFQIQGGNPYSIFNFRGWWLIVTNREKYIVATVIRWLGTNVGWCWLTKVLKECGYELVFTEKGKELYEQKYKESMEFINNHYSTQNTDCADIHTCTNNTKI